MKIKENDVNAVEMMRKIREELTLKYEKEPLKQEEDLLKIRKKYKIKTKAELIDFS